MLFGTLRPDTLAQLFPGLQAGGSSDWVAAGAVCGALQGAVLVPVLLLPLVLPTSPHPLTTSCLLWSGRPLLAAARQDTPHPESGRKEPRSSTQTPDLHSRSLQPSQKHEPWNRENSKRILITLLQKHRERKQAVSALGRLQLKSCGDLNSWHQFAGAALGRAEPGRAVWWNHTLSRNSGRQRLQSFLEGGRRCSEELPVTASYTHSKNKS